MSGPVGLGVRPTKPALHNTLPIRVTLSNTRPVAPESAIFISQNICKAKATNPLQGSCLKLFTTQRILQILCLLCPSFFLVTFVQSGVAVRFFLVHLSGCTFGLKPLPERRFPPSQRDCLLRARKRRTDNFKLWVLLWVVASSLGLQVRSTLISCF